ncbi:MAG: hypothetical protein V7707_04505 [Motiliproteus sp.]
MFNSIKYKLLLTHFILIVIVIGGLGIKQSSQQLEFAESQTIIYHKNISQKFITQISAALAGNNYGKIYLPVFNEELKNTSTLNYLEVEGISDSDHIYQIAYQKDIGKTWRKKFPSNFKENLENKIKKFNNLLKNQQSDSIKLNFLLDRSYNQLAKHQQSIEYIKTTKDLYDDITFKLGVTIDKNKWTMELVLPTINENGGASKFVYDISDLKTIKENILKNTAMFVLNVENSLPS